MPPGVENREIRNIKSVEKRNQQDPTAIAQGTLLNVKWQPGGGTWGRADTCIHMVGSLCCPPETIPTLLISYTVI